MSATIDPDEMPNSQEKKVETVNPKPVIAKRKPGRPRKNQNDLAGSVPAVSLAPISTSDQPLVPPSPIVAQPPVVPAEPMRMVGRSRRG